LYCRPWSLWGSTYRTGPWRTAFMGFRPQIWFHSSQWRFGTTFFFSSFSFNYYILTKTIYSLPYVQAYNLGSGNGATGNDFLNNVQPITAITPYLVGLGILIAWYYYLYVIILPTIYFIVLLYNYLQEITNIYLVLNYTTTTGSWDRKYWAMPLEVPTLSCGIP
jgi:hypothetical protein